MEAYQSTSGEVRLRCCAALLPRFHACIHNKERAHEPSRAAPQVNYIEFASTDIERTKKFYTSVFGWSFVDYGPDYASFTAVSSGIDGGFYKTPSIPPPTKTSPLVVLYSADLKATEAAILATGGAIVVPTFEFPGGRRFHFSDGAGNVLAVWSE